MAPPEELERAAQVLRKRAAGTLHVPLERLGDALGGGDEPDVVHLVGEPPRDLRALDLVHREQRPGALRAHVLRLAVEDGPAGQRDDDGERQEDERGYQQAAAAATGRAAPRAARAGPVAGRAELAVARHCSPSPAPATAEAHDPARRTGPRSGAHPPTTAP